MSRFVDDSPLEGGGFELPVPRAMQERLKAIIAGFGCNPPSPDYLRLLSADITEGGPKRSLGTGSLNARGTGSSNPFPSSGQSPANLSFRRIEVQGRSREADGDSRFWRQVLEGCQIPRHALANRLVVTAQPLGKPSATTLEELLVQRHKARRPRYRHQQVSADPADQPFVVWAKLASLAEEL